MMATYGVLCRDVDGLITFHGKIHLPRGRSRGSPQLTLRPCGKDGPVPPVFFSPRLKFPVMDGTRDIFLRSKKSI